MTWTAEAIKGGWLRKTGATSRERIKVVTLTSKGVAWVEQRRREIFRYSELDPHRIAPMTIWHNLLAQRATIEAVRAGKAKSYLTERQDATKSRRGEKKPDAIWITETHERIGVEIELNAKWDQRFDEFVASTIAALSLAADGAPARFHKFVLLTTSPALAARYASAFDPSAPLRIWRVPRSQKRSLSEPSRSRNGSVTESTSSWSTTTEKNCCLHRRPDSAANRKRRAHRLPYLRLRPGRS